MFDPTTRVSNLKEKYFNEIKSGQKTVEGRLKPWLKDTVVGDIIIWNNEIRTEIIAIKEAKNFAELYDMYGERLLPGVKSREAAIKVYDEFYPKIPDDGVIGIELKLL